MHYPLNLNGVTVHPLFGNFLKGKPYIFDFSSNNPKVLDYNLFDFEELNGVNQVGRLVATPLTQVNSYAHF